jgi:nucleotide-binding universal stress UspA family protein
LLSSSIQEAEIMAENDAHNVLLAFDGSDHANAAIQMLLDIPLARCEPPNQETHVTVLSVMPTQYITGHEQMQAALDRACATLEEKGLKATGILKAGNPAMTINNLAKELDAQLIMIGAKGLRATLGILLGGVAQTVVEYATCPVLVVRAPYKGIHRVLLGIDGSAFGQRALEYLAPGPSGMTCPVLPGDAHVNVMHVLPPIMPPEAAMRAWTIGPEVIYPAPAQPIDWKALEEEEREQGRKLLDEAAAALRQESILTNPVLIQGDASTEIIDYAREHQIDLIVCGGRGWSEVASWFMGSVSRKLVHYAPCSVLVVK